VYKIEDRELLIERLKVDKRLRRLCGWETTAEIPSAATFCRAFADFAAGELPQQIHEALVQDHVQPVLVGHVSRDSTPIAVREKPAKKPAVEVAVPRRRGRPRKGEERPQEVRRLEVQPHHSLAENLRGLPTACDVGTKKDSQGRKKSWTGYKLHVDTIDGDVPVSAILTSASVHDSQVAIPLAQITADRVLSLYDLMDAAYDAPEIKDFSRALGHVPIIDHNPRRGDKIEFDPATAVRYHQRSSSERVNSNLKDNYLPARIRVRGACKVMAEIMFGMVALTANQLFDAFV
jgi:hypothetical protein